MLILNVNHNNRSSFDMDIHIAAINGLGPKCYSIMAKYAKRSYITTFCCLLAFASIFFFSLCALFFS